ncbi:MAG: hypothetical protein U0790_00195 [Isosphaeraceae bacterium]
MNTAEATRQDMRVTLAGVEYSLPVRTLQDLGPLQAWFLREIPSPMTRALASLSQCERQGIEVAPAVRSVLLDAAIRHEQAWPPAMGSRKWLLAVDDRDQVGHLIAWGLGPRHPHLTEEMAAAIAIQATNAELAIYCRALISGKLPDPKAPAPPPDPGEPTPPSTTGPATATTGTP